MNTKHSKRYVHEGSYAAEVTVDLIETDDWSPCISTESMNKLDDVREALRRGDVQAASKLARVYALTLVAG